MPYLGVLCLRDEFGLWLFVVMIGGEEEEKQILRKLDKMNRIQWWNSSLLIKLALSSVQVVFAVVMTKG